MMDEGKAQRTFCFITDMIEMLLNILLSGREIAYNICGKEAITIKDLAKLIAQINQAKFNDEFSNKTSAGAPLILSMDNNRYLSEFNKEKFIPLREGLEITSKWFKNIKP